MKIRCSTLEIVRRNPIAYAQLLANGDVNSKGGTYGMFACFQDTARLVHTSDLDFNEGIKELHKKFLRFDDNKKNKERQDKLIEQFIEYCNAYKKQKFEFEDGSHNINWSITSEVKLTGRSPWVVKNKSGLFSYILTERSFDWAKELRFPLIQKYQADNTLKCNLHKLNIGIYSLESRKFEFHSFSDSEVNNAVDETQGIFESVYEEFHRKQAA